MVDGTFLTHALQNKLHVKEQLPKILSGRVTPMVTGCVLAELRSLGDRALGAAIIAKGYYRVKCSHATAVGASQCIKEQVGDRNERKFLVASQDPRLVRELREVPGVPVLRLNGPVPFLEEPSTASRAVANAGEQKKLKASDWEKPRLPVLRAAEAKAAEANSKPKKLKGPKGANPLSCLQPKPKPKEAAPKPAEAPPAAAKRTRSRRMGTRTRAEAESLLLARTETAASSPAVANSAAAAEAEDEGEIVADAGAQEQQTGSKEGGEKERSLKRGRKKRRLTA